MVSIELMITPTKSWSVFSPWSDSNGDPFKGVRGVPVLDILIMGFHSQGATPLDASKWTIHDNPIKIDDVGLFKFYIMLHFRKSSYMIYMHVMIYFIHLWYIMYLTDEEVNHVFLQIPYVIGTAGNMSIDIDLKWMSWNHQTSTYTAWLLHVLSNNMTQSRAMCRSGGSQFFGQFFSLRKFLKDGSLDWFKGKSTGNHGFYHQI